MSPRWSLPLSLLVHGVTLDHRDDDQDKRIGQGAASEAVSLLEATLDAIEEGILVVDNDGGVINYNDRFLELWRIPEHLAEGGEDAQLLDFVEDQLEDPQDFRQRVRELYDDPDAVSEDRIHFEDGRVFERTSRPQTAGGETVGRVWSFRDVTDTVQTNRELEERNEQLENFASLVSHDLREPLRSIATHLQQLERHAEASLDDHGRSHLDAAVDNAGRCQEMIKGLHRLSSIHRRTPDLRPLPLKEIVKGVLVNLESSIRQADATVEFGSLPMVKGDRSQLVTLFQNLIENAVTYRGSTPPTVTIRTRPLEGDRVEVEVGDDGPGIAEDDQESIFEMFSRGSSGDTDGSGIGLALVRRIVRRHGGEIEVESSPGNGARFRFSLPAGDDSSKA